ncbi:MAG: acyl-phosphate glycerol 3-phosphate acyltransferase [Desulfobulbaceae bacterium C00003063]|nr:MAG: acyl-phosphate glycerol 3-phosphate acyltransferase [Desulfobulbaceae bacterium C00003063]
MVMSLFFLLFGYLAGSIPFGLVFSKMAGIDVRTEGSCNIGATNVNRVLGRKLGFLTLVCDCLKGYIPIYLAALFLPESENRELIVVITGIMAVIGHMFPVYLGFKGGKGVATSLGVFLFLSPVVILISLAVFIAAVALSGFVSAGSLLASGLVPVWLWLLGSSKIAIAAAAIIGLLIWVKHHENIRRLLQGNEKSWKK